MISKLRRSINRTLFWLKWPVAVFMMLLVPVVYQIFKQHYFQAFSFRHTHIIYFGVGFVLFLGMRIAFSPNRGTTETMEHEMTHTLFAMATCHPVHRIEVYDEGGGQMSYYGEGNWLISLAPYFFPLAAFGMVILSILVSGFLGYTPTWVYLGLGAAVAYNVRSFVQQTHPGQTDFKKAGYLFSICFLPGANMLTYGLIYAFVSGGFKGIQYFASMVVYYSLYESMALYQKLSVLI